MNLNKYVFLALGQLFSVFSFSQSPLPFQKAYVITLQNDTLRGEILSEESNLYHSIQFRQFNRPQQSFDPTSLNGFVIFEGTQVFNSYRGLPYYAKGKRDTANVFMKRLVAGVASLYYFKDKVGDKHHFLNKGDQLLELRHQRKEVRLPNGKTDYLTETSFNGAFNLLLGDCDTKSYDVVFADRKSTRLNSSHSTLSRMPSSA